MIKTHIKYPLRIVFI